MHETDTQFVAPPGWGTPFPPEQPRRDAVQDAMPTAASVAAASFTGEELHVNPQFEDRRRLDRRRLMAHVIDEIVLVAAVAAAYMLFEGAAVGTVLMYLALKLSYYLVLETVFGQTLGKRAMRLRVVLIETGTGAPANRIAARTIFRFFDEAAAIMVFPWVGGISMLMTGPKRQRFGDIAAGTCVRDDDRQFKPGPESPLMVVYPVMWIGAALAAGLSLPDKPFLEYFRSDHPYMAKIDRICEKRVRQTRAMQSIEGDNIITWRIFFRQEQKKIEELPPPPKEIRGDVKEVLRIHRQFNRELDKALDKARNAPDPMASLQNDAPHLQTLAENAGERFAELGLPHCAQ